jgi:hypothetical protein
LYGEKLLHRVSGMQSFSIILYFLLWVNELSRKKEKKFKREL